MHDTAKDKLTAVSADLLLEAILAPAYACDRNTYRIIAVNQRAINKHGIRRSQFLKMNLGDLEADGFHNGAQKISTAARITTIPDSFTPDNMPDEKTSEQLRPVTSDIEHIIETCINQLNDIILITEHENSRSDNAARLENHIEFTQLISRSTSADDSDFYMLFAASAQSLLNADGAALALIKNEELAYITTHGAASPCQGASIPITGKAAASYIEREGAFVSDDVEFDDRWIFKIWKHKGVRSVIAIAIQRDDRPFGVLNIISRDKNAFTNDDVSSLKLFAQHFSAVLKRRHLEQQIRDLQPLLSLGRLTGGIAHDINNLLGVILECTDSLTSNIHHDQGQLQSASLARAAAEKGVALTNRLLAFARQQPPDPCPVNPGELVANMEDFLKRVLGSNIEVNIVHAADSWPVLIDPALLESVIMNLCLNARDAMPGGGTITIKLENCRLHGEISELTEEHLPGRYVVISVSDTGPGIPPEITPHVLDPFFTTKAPGEGCGLGLAMVSDFIRRSKGRVMIEPEQKKGATIRLILPRAKLPPASAKNTRDTPESRANTKILLVENNDLVRANILSQLRRLGYQVFESRNGHEAIYTICNIPDIALMLTGLSIPDGMDGKKTAEEILKLRPDIKILFTSDCAQFSDFKINNMDFRGAFIRQPFGQSDIENKIAEILFDEAPC